MKIIISIILFSFIFSEVTVSNTGMVGLITDKGCVDGNCENGFGTFIYNSGDIYEGNFSYGKMDGLGIRYYHDIEISKVLSGDKGLDYLIFRKYVDTQKKLYNGNIFHGNIIPGGTGDIYIGTFKENSRSGYGTYYFSRGPKLICNYKNDKKDGVGVYFYNNKDRYVGEFNQGKFTGEAIKFSNMGKTIESGEWIDDKLVYEMEVNKVIEDLSLKYNSDDDSLASIIINEYLISFYYSLIEIPRIMGCNDKVACNFNAKANFNDGTCIYSVGNFDCKGNCLVAIDCWGTCGGLLVEDECGICNGNGISEGLCNCDGNIPIENFDCNGNCLVDIDCTGECGGNAKKDECGICNGGGKKTCLDGTLSCLDHNCITNACELPENTIYILNNIIYYNFDINVYGYQISTNSNSLISANGGDSDKYDIVVNIGGNSVMGFAFDNGYIPKGCGELIILNSIKDIDEIISALAYNKSGIPLNLEVFIDQ